MSTWGNLLFQNGSSSIMEHLVFFHDHIMIIMVMVMMMVGYILLNSCFNNFYNLKMFHGQELESIWTLVPALFLMLIAFPSLRVLYLMEDNSEYDITIKVMGHQWYWSYEYSDLGCKFFDSYMLSDKDSMFRLLDVDNCLVFPLGSNTRVMVSSEDVIHSWTIPSMGVKVDAIPGRLNQLFMMFNRVGVFSGQCSEICGVNHSFMPIKVMVVPRLDFLVKWFM